MKKIYTVALFCASILFFTNCGGGKSGMSASHVKIPQDVAFVASFAPAQMQKKAENFKKLASNQIVKLLKDEPIGKMLDLDATAAIVLDAIDLNQTVYAFGKEDKDKSYGAISFVIANEAKFKQIFDKMQGIKPAFKNENGVQIANLAPFFPIAIGYKGKTGLVVVHIPEAAKIVKTAIEESKKSQRPTETPKETTPPDEEGFATDDADTPTNKPKGKGNPTPPQEENRPKVKEEVIKPKPISDEELKKIFLQVFNTTEKDQLKQEDFLKNEAKGYDIAIWYDMEKSAKTTQNSMQGLGTLASSPVLNKLTEIKGYSTTGINFENGQVTFETNFNINPETAKKYANTLAKTGWDKVSTTFPLEKATTLLGFSLGMKDMFNIFKEDKMAMEGMEANIREFDLGVKPEDMFEVFDGNFAMATGEIDMKEIFGGQPNFVFGMGINKQDVLQKLLKNKNFLESMRMETVAKDVYEIPIMRGVSAFVVLKGNKLYLTTSEKNKESILAGKSGFKNTLSSNTSAGLYINLETIAPVAAGFLLDNEETAEQAKKLKDFSFSSTPLNGNTINAKSALKFMNNKNALITIMELLDANTKGGKSKGRELSLRNEK